jgi:hypothetical protein
MCCTNSQTANYRYSTNKQNNNNKNKMLITTYRRPIPTSSITGHKIIERKNIIK